MGSSAAHALVRRSAGCDAAVTSALEGDRRGTARSLILFVAIQPVETRPRSACRTRSLVPDVQLAIGTSRRNNRRLCPVARGRPEHSRPSGRRSLDRSSGASRVVVTVNSTVALDAGVLESAPSSACRIICRRLSPREPWPARPRSPTSNRPCGESCMIKNSVCKLSAAGANTWDATRSRRTVGPRIARRTQCWLSPMARSKDLEPSVASASGGRSRERNND